MKKIHIGTSPITGNIYAGNLLKDGMTWGSNQQDVTGAACGAVCEHVISRSGEVTVRLNGKPKYKITVTDIDVNATDSRQAEPAARDVMMALANEIFYETTEAARLADDGFGVVFGPVDLSAIVDRYRQAEQGRSDEQHHI